MTAEFSSEFQLKPIESGLYQGAGTAVHRKTMTREVKGIVFTRHSFCIPNYLRILLVPGAP
jgi:hypothetical protein